MEKILQSEWNDGGRKPCLSALTMEEAKDWTDSDPWGVTGGWRMGTPRGKRSLEQRGRDTDGYTLIQWLDIQEHGRQRPIRWGLRNRTLPSALGTCRTHCYIPSPSSQSRRPQSSVIWVPTPACRARYLLCPLPQSCPLRALTGRPRQKRHRFLLLCRELPGGRQGVLSTLQMLQSSLLIDLYNIYSSVTLENALEVTS